jgi:DnaD/phage-associated family protein
MTDANPSPQSKIIRRVETSVSGFTPCPDVLVEKYSHTTALIWGKIWRFEQMSEGVCRASLLRLGKELNMDVKTIAKHIAMLENGEYVYDSTPDVRNRPHVYKTTSKLVLRISIDMGDGGTENFPSRYGKFPYEESTTNSETGEKPNLFAVYQANIGLITPLIADSLKDAEQQYPPEWIVEAIGLAVANNKRNWRYCESILKRWQADGKDDGKGKTKSADIKNDLKKAGYDVD